MTFDFLSPVVTSTRPKSQDQKPVGSKARVETNGRTETDTTDCSTVPANAVGNHARSLQRER